MDIKDYENWQLVSFVDGIKAILAVDYSVKATLPQNFSKKTIEIENSTVKTPDPLKSLLKATYLENCEL